LPFSMSQASLPVFQIGLNALSALLDKADTVAAFGLHGALLLGPAEAITPANADGCHRALAAFGISLLRDGVVGPQTNVMGKLPAAVGGTESAVTSSL